MAKEKKVVAETVEPVATETKPEKKSKKMTFSEGIIKISGLLADVPDAVAIGIISKPNTDGGNERVYAFLNTSQQAKKARESVSEVLKEVYQGGAYNIMQFATALRIDEKAVQGLIDEEFIERQGL